MMKFEKIFRGLRIIGFAGDRHTGKSNNLVSLILDFKKYNNKTPIYVYGFNREINKFLKGKGVIEVSTLKQITLKKDCILIIDEFQKLRLNDRKYRDDLNDFADFIYHNNVKVILASPSLREFNSIIGSKIEGWMLKSLSIEDLINGCQLKRVVEEYKGTMKVFKSLQIPKSEILVVNNDKEEVIKLDYIEEVDTKKGNKDLFEKLSENCQKKSNRIVRKLSRKKRVAWNKGLPKELQPHYGKKHSKEAKAKIGDGNKGKIISKEQREIASKNMTGNKNWVGKKHTKETKEKISKSQMGENNNRWIGGRVKTGAGYIRIYSPDHPNKDNSGYVLEHRLVMEKDIGRYLCKEEVVHHENKIRNDNRIENLRLFESKGKHKKFHLKQDREDLKRLRIENEELKKNRGC